MSSVRFSSRNLRSEVRSTDGDDYGIDFTQSLDDYIAEAEAVVADPLPALQTFNRFRSGTRSVVSYSSYPTVLALRVLGSFLRRKYSLQTETREAVSRGLIQALADSSTMRILRRDIASFYESVPTSVVKEELLYRDVLPPRARRMLETFFEIHCVADVGLPRGLGLSAILSEYVMKPVDAAIRLIPGVYRYHRFVDDIIVFSTPEGRNISRALAAALPAPMCLSRSRSKCDDVVLPRPHGNDSSRISFDYLGYSYEATLAHSPKKPRKIRVGIASAKINRLKSRLILTARQLLQDNDSRLFTDRIAYLTGNYRFVKRRPIASTGRSVVKSGIFYNYRYCGSYSGEVRVSHDMAELRRLDWFLQHVILGGRSPLGFKVLQLLSATELARAQRLSFAQGHLRAFDCGFDSARVSAIREAWKNV
jgi:Reverse transcriptase (RNA-dependent DNA polymerase).